MKRTGRIIPLVLSCGLFLILGCRKEKASQETSAKDVDPCELKIQEAFRRISDWRFYHGDSRKYNATMSMLSGELKRISDRARRRNYIMRLAEVIFAYPLDATNPGHEGFHSPLIRLLQALGGNNGTHSG